MHWCRLVLVCYSYLLMFQQLVVQLYKLITDYILEIWQEIAFKILISVCQSTGDTILVVQFLC